MNNANITRYLQMHATTRPDQVLLEANGTTLTSRQLEGAVARAAGGFSRLGIVPNDTVVLLIPLSIPLYVSMFALQRIGAIPVFLDSWARSHELAQVLMFALQDRKSVV